MVPARFRPPGQGLGRTKSALSLSGFPRGRLHGPCSPRQHPASNSTSSVCSHSHRKVMMILLAYRQTLMFLLLILIIPPQAWVKLYEVIKSSIQLATDYCSIVQLHLMLELRSIKANGNVRILKNVGFLLH